eukprot:357703_1
MALLNGTTQAVEAVSKTVHKQVGGTCYANAVATVIRAVESRIVGRKPEPHATLVTNIVNKYGTDGGNVSKVLNDECAKRHLKFDIVDEKDAEKALSQNRVLVGGFWLDDPQWAKFSAYFKKLRKGVVTKEIIGKQTEKDTVCGHAVAIIGVGDGYWKIKNSWGDKFADSGYFRVAKNAFKWEFYDVYFRVCDLTKEDLDNFKAATTSVTSCAIM